MASIGDLYTALNNIAQNLGKLIAQTALQIVVPITQGGTGAVTAAAARTNLGVPATTMVGVFLLGELLAADFNVTTDQNITLTLPTGLTNWVIESIVVSNASISLTTAVGGIYTAPAKAGVAVVSGSQRYAGLTGSPVDQDGSALLLTIDQTIMLNLTILYFSLTTPQGVAATADLHVYARALW
jgi:hypothetical protein